ncbi:Choline-sulfatase [Minicystis rosea]|nr:Choline-sulfatase [Minicystis rosea]
MSVPADVSATADPRSPDVRASGLRAAAGLVAGFALVALVNAGAIVLTIPLPSSLALRVAHHTFDAAETLGLGLLAGALVGGFSAFVRLPVWAAAIVYAAATAPLLHLAFGDQLLREANVFLEGRVATPLFVLTTFLTSFAVSAAHIVGALLSRFPRVRFVPVVLALAVLVVDHVVMADDYFGIHCGIAWIAATLAGAAIAPLAERMVLALAARRGGRVVLGAFTAVAVLGLIVPPSNAVRMQLFRQPVALAPWVLATAVWPMPHPRTPQPPPDSPWFRDRAGLPPVPPTPAPRALPTAPVVVMITVDATRAEAINDPRNDALFPTLADMKRHGTWFRNATSPGGQTAVSLTTTFSGRAFSELAWTMHGAGSSRFLYAAADPAPRFPGLLTEAGVPTAIECSINFLAGHFGVARGFQEERVIATGRRHALAKQMIDPVLERLRRAGPTDSLFLYTHLMEPHAPYDRGRKDGTDYEKYLSEIAVADAQIGRVARLLDLRFAGRGILIVSADHGEAFGEHGTREHTKTIYDELLRVPLLVRGAGVSHREVDEHVGLVDLGPTILDIFNVPTPATFGGQSLVPILLGRPATLDRPLVAEGRLRRAIYTKDDVKVIADTRRKVIEVYDLARDPNELQNLWDEDRPRSDRALGQLEAWFSAHALQKPGYRTPYKP